jgi:exonuclease SbcC
MRPICLKVAGLHSFREEQVIQFADLCQGGVFGIFGPTGSGKSTILDAITLALYGKVERASNNTVGIMNQSENQLTVSFTFELGNASGTKKYRVERSYKRSDDVRLRNASSRLVEIIKGEETVIADKDREVTNEVEKILGLTVDDFTRAVVLPQGKFAEFLSLKGSDRRQMLQRLFNLEQYGDRLNARLKERYDQTKNRLTTIEAEQLGLGDASLDALNRAKEKLKQAQLEANQKRKELVELESKFAELKQIWNWQREKEELEQKRTKLSAEESVIKALEEKLQKGEQAESLRPYLEELQSAEENLNHCMMQAEQTEKVYEQVKHAYEEKKNRFEQARLNSTKQEPQLLVQLERYKQAKEIKEQILLREQEYESQKEQFLRLKNDYTVKQDKLDKLKHTLEKAVQKQTQIKEELQKKSVKAEERQKVTQAVQLKQTVERISTEKKEIEAEIAKREEQYKEIEIRLRLNEDAERQFQRNISDLSNELLKEYNLICETERKLIPLTEGIHHVYKLVQRTMEQKKEQLLASQLAQELKEGSPCPVCGSTTHPNPVSRIIDSDLQEIETRLSELEELLQQVNKQEREIAQQKFQLEQLSKRLHETIPVMGEFGKETAANLEHILSFGIGQESVLETVHSNLSVQEQIAGFHAENAWTEKQILEYAKRISVLEEKRKELTKQFSLVQQKRSELTIHAENVLQQLKDLRDKASVQNKELEQQVELWQNHYSEYSLDTILQVQEELHAREKEIEELNDRYNLSVQFIEERQRESNGLQHELNQLAITCAQIETDLSNTYKQIESDQQKLREITNNQVVEHLIERVTHQLIRLKEEEEKAKQELETVEQLLRKCEGEYLAAKEAYSIAQNRLHAAQYKWENELKERDFKTRSEVQASLISKQEQREWRERIESYRNEMKHVEMELNKVQTLLSGRHLNEAEWQQAQQELETTKEALEEALNQKAKAERDFEDLEQKHVRWNELDKLRRDIQEMLNRLQKLQTVFRGNAFVEFIAEEQLLQISRDASSRLGRLTRGRYAIEVDSQGGFVIRDDYNGGVKRPVTTLSGGETFLTSLALALSLSAQIQLRGEYPLEFFFLDEGFGTLDPELLDTVITALEQLHAERLSVGVISHVMELRDRIVRKLVVEPAEPSGRGSRVRLEGV